MVRGKKKKLSRCKTPGCSKLAGQLGFWVRNVCIFIWHSGGLQIGITLLVFHTFFTEWGSSCCPGSSLRLFSMFCEIISPLPRQILVPWPLERVWRSWKNVFRCYFYIWGDTLKFQIKRKTKQKNKIKITNFLTDSIAFFLWGVYILVGWISPISASERS